MEDTQRGITFHHVQYQIDDKVILKNISGNFKSGKITSLLGPSGSGKTTILKLCNGLISPTKGEILVHGKPIHSYSPTVLRRKVGIALQQSPMVQGTVFDNLALPLQLQGKTLSEEKATDAISKVGLDASYLKENSSDLSGGQKQRVAIARTLMNEPDILLLDEITASLDQEASQQIETLLQSINKNFGVTMIWITHHLEQAKKVSDEMWLIEAGEMIETGPISLLTDSSNERIKHFVQGGIS